MIPMADIKIFGHNIEGHAISQCYDIGKTTAFKHAKIRIMPDAHSGKGCVVGFTAANWTYINPAVVGVDIGCGMRVVKLGNINIDFKKLDEVIHTFVPSGHATHEYVSNATYKHIEELCDSLTVPVKGANRQGIIHSIGTLGGGNHFIEIDKDEDNCKYLIIHTGSRHLGQTVAAHHIQTAVRNLHKEAVAMRNNAIIDKLKAEHREKDIEKNIASQQTVPYIHPDNAYLFGKAADDYLHDMQLVQTFAEENRIMIANIITKHMKWNTLQVFESIHNYIDFQDNIIRKGAIAAYTGQPVIIPLNMKDGCILGHGKSNANWNYSAPHGAGRILSRADAKATLSMKQFKEEMKGIFSTSICPATLDESPMSYKPAQDIIDVISPTVEITKIIKPIYNFKAH